MYTDATLPFPRGSTYKDNGELTLSSNTTCGAGIVGRLFETTDSSGRPLVLRAVRADAAISAGAAGHAISYTAGKVGTNSAAATTTLTSADGVVSSIVDYAYGSAKAFDIYDIFYVVEEGHVYAHGESGVNAAGISVQCNNSTGTVEPAVAASYVIGISDEEMSATVSGFVSIYVTGGLKPSEAAG